MPYKNPELHREQISVRQKRYYEKNKDFINFKLALKKEAEKELKEIMNQDMRLSKKLQLWLETKIIIEERMKVDILNYKNRP